MKTILVVEDSLAVQLFLRETLESNGYKTFGAFDGKMAYEILTKYGIQIDLVLTDYHMPNIGGYDLLEKVKSQQTLANIPFIFLTGESNPLLIDNARNLGVTSWIKKPYLSHILLAEINKVFLKN